VSPLLESTEYSGTEEDALAGVVQLLFDNPFHMRYDTDTFAAPYYVPESGLFHLTDYLDPQNPRDVVCHDQAAAVYVFSAVLGIEAPIQYWERYGFVKSINLVGVDGPSNNPLWETFGGPMHDTQWSPRQLITEFFESEGVVFKTRDADGRYRTLFKNHSTNILSDTPGTFFDATVGPLLGITVSDLAGLVVDYAPYDQLGLDHIGNPACILDSQGLLDVSPLERSVDDVQ
jgi:hypothetical protein